MFNIKKITAALFGLCCLPAVFAAKTPMPAHMPTEPMPAFNFFMPKASVLSHRAPTIHVQYYHKLMAHHHCHAHLISVYPGSLKTNVIRLSRAYGWKHVVWLPNDDYHWIGKVSLAANNLPTVLRKILSDYPVQANFYAGNHVLVILPRTIQA